MIERRRLPGRIDLVTLHALRPDRYPFLLKSTGRQGALGRYEILFGFPGDAIVATDDPNESRRFLDRLDDAFAQVERPGSASSLPFHGGWFLYLGYELAGEVEPALSLGTDTHLPKALAVRCPAALIRDLDNNELWFVSEAGVEERYALVRSDIASLDGRRVAEDLPVVISIEESVPDAFTAAVEQAKRYIGSGDIYQANLSRSWTVRAADDFSSHAVWARLAERNPAPFAGLLRWDGVSIVSSSPERLVSVRGDVVSTRPIAGTRPRSPDDALDKALLDELIAHPKERAEHVMLIDLERNDLGRVSMPGTVRVDEMMVLETYAHVHHIVSNVSGVLKPGTTPGDVVAAVFPGGTITGCPKVRCMEIIQELEDGPRGAYTGSFGYLNRDGSMDLNILIRSLVLSGSEAHFRAGAGIVADSEPRAELEETRAKAKGLRQVFDA